MEEGLLRLLWYQRKHQSHWYLYAFTCVIHNTSHNKPLLKKTAGMCWEKQNDNFNGIVMGFCTTDLQFFMQNRWLGSAKLFLVVGWF